MECASSGCAIFFFFCARAATLLFFSRGSKGQRRERQKLDAAAELLPAGCVVHGYLGDSFLFSSSDGGFSAEATVRHLRHHHFQIHFKGGGKLSFLAHPPPLQDFLDDDKALQRAMELPMARTVTADCNTRSVPRQFMEYQHPDRLRLARAILKAMAWLTEGGDCRDGVMALHEDIVEELEAASMGHAMWRSIFRDPHGGDWNVALFQARLIFESVVGKAAKKIEFATLKDNGDGLTGKGTLRELCEKALGVHNGGVERGYCAVLCQEALTVGKQERPREQFANLQGSRFAWVDDFAPNQPLCCCFAADLRREHLDGCAEGPGREHFQLPRTLAALYQRRVAGRCRVLWLRQRASSSSATLWTTRHAPTSS